jgi:ABC-type branched-subunit amino acid transport system ATPase component
MSDVALAVRNLTAGYGGPPIIRDLTLEAKLGQILAIVGPNGAGKSTLLRAAFGQLRISSGTVLLDGEPVTGLSSDALVRRGLGYVPQVSNVFPSLSVLENLEMGGYTRKSLRKQQIERMCTLFPDLRLALPRAAGTLSGGQRNMLALARALMPNPRVLLVDEPTAGLSPQYVNTVWEHIGAIRADGLCVLVVEQNTRRALRYADWAHVLVQGESKVSGSGADLLADDQIASLYIGGRKHDAPNPMV